MILSGSGDGKVGRARLPNTCGGFIGLFDHADAMMVAAGNLVVVYIASVRASARVLTISPHSSHAPPSPDVGDNPDDVFSFDISIASDNLDADKSLDGPMQITLQFLKYREWIEMGSQVLVMPGGGPGLYAGSERGVKKDPGLNGFVGKVLEVFD
jgi:hypothetical protein